MVILVISLKSTLSLFPILLTYIMKMYFSDLKYSISTLLDFNEVFEVKINVSSLAYGVVLGQGHPTTYYNEKFNETKKKYTLYIIRGIA
jgi:hypothetical protein